jgi:undecaprenyl-diphosphatase
MHEPDLFFDTMVHCGTLVAVLIVFRIDVCELIGGGFRLVKGVCASREERRALIEAPQTKLIILILIACIPTGLMGILFKDFFEYLFSSVLAVGIALMITGTLLLLTRIVRRAAGSEKTLGWFEAFVIGCTQSLAITPGISRSGSTIATALLLGIDRETAGRFSFLIFIPAILGAILLNAHLPEVHTSSYLATVGAATVAAALTGYGALKLLLRFVHRGKLFVFAPYCYGVGILAIVAAL